MTIVRWRSSPRSTSWPCGLFSKVNAASRCGRWPSRSIAIIVRCSSCSNANNHRAGGGFHAVRIKGPVRPPSLGRIVFAYLGSSMTDHLARRDQEPAEEPCPAAIINACIIGKSLLLPAAVRAFSGAIPHSPILGPPWRASHNLRHHPIAIGPFAAWRASRAELPAVGLRINGLSPLS